MTDIDILRKMIKDSARVEIVVENGKNQVTLIESHPDAKEVKVPIYGLPEETIVIKTDSFKSPDSLFKCENGECKRADFVIIAETNKKKVIICIEMKVKKDSEKEIIQQLTGTQCLIMYCQALGKTFWKEPDFLKDYVYRFVSIGNISIAKRKTRFSRTMPKHDRPDKLLKVDWPHHISFNILAGGES
ncbi:MAG: hypothetical protein BWK79_07270 [Beggiatoa sp. IS2]|nr:MAG: hypothetical protein BWK79_07270 [Beggiatoa sp. IS2]